MNLRRIPDVARVIPDLVRSFLSYAKRLGALKSEPASAIKEMRHRTAGLLLLHPLLSYEMLRIAAPPMLRLWHLEDPQPALPVLRGIVEALRASPHGPAIGRVWPWPDDSFLEELAEVFEAYRAELLRHVGP